MLESFSDARIVSVVKNAKEQLCVLGKCLSYGGDWYAAVRDTVKELHGNAVLKQTFLKATIFKRECKTTSIFLLWVKFSVPLFFGVLMYDNEFKRMGNKI